MTDKIRTGITNNRLALTLLFYILLSSAFFTFVLSGFKLYRIHKEHMQEVQNVFNQIEKSYINSIMTSLWAYDTYQLEAQVQGLLNLHPVVRAEIRVLTGNQWKPVVEKGEIRDRKFLIKNYTLKRNGPGGEDIVGTLTVYAGLDWIRSDVLRQVFSTVFIKVVEILALSFCILVILHHLIMKHLTRIAQHLRLLDLNQLDQRLELMRRSSVKKDIFDFIVEAINAISEYLATDIKRRSEVEKELRDANEKLEISKREIEEQSRIKTIQMLVSDILREEENLEGLASRLVSYLCRVMDAGVGLFYYVDDKNEKVRAVGAFASDKADLTEKTFFFGEGVVGQVVLNRKMMLLDVSGDSDMVIRSVLGRERPSHILVFPFERKGRVTAVLEAGSFHPFSKEQIYFLEQISERVSVATEAAVYRRLVVEPKKDDS